MEKTIILQSIENLINETTKQFIEDYQIESMEEFEEKMDEFINEEASRRVIYYIDIDKAIDNYCGSIDDIINNYSIEYNGDYFRFNEAIAYYINYEEISAELLQDMETLKKHFDFLENEAPFDEIGEAIKNDIEARKTLENEMVKLYQYNFEAWHGNVSKEELEEGIKDIKELINGYYSFDEIKKQVTRDLEDMLDRSNEEENEKFNVIMGALANYEKYVE